MHASMQAAGGTWGEIAKYALQTRVMLGLTPDTPLERELVAFVLGGCGMTV